jgi:hypothetical protein
VRMRRFGVGGNDDNDRAQQQETDGRARNHCASTSPHETTKPLHERIGCSDHRLVNASGTLPIADE